LNLDIPAWLAHVRKTYGVNPLIFGALYLAGVLPFWFSIYRILAGLKNRNFKSVRIFGLILGAAIILPFLYVAVFGHNLPCWFWIIVGAIVMSSVFSVFRRLKRS
jgi:hypothetical protein